MGYVCGLPALILPVMQLFLIYCSKMYKKYSEKYVIRVVSCFQISMILILSGMKFLWKKCKLSINMLYRNCLNCMKKLYIHMKNIISREYFIYWEHTARSI